MLARNLSDLGAASKQNGMPRASTRFSIAGGIGLNFGKLNAQTSKGSLPTIQDSARSQADELHVENERLKTTLTILTQKLKVIEDDNSHA